ncbi:MAG: hypothetical protein KDE33_09420 [Bacteroidetes bacterium]|nr:hypothetical protein [Bacteroidota bacterium]
MRKDAWRCNNDDHFNKNTDTECEICGEKRPIIKVLEYQLTDKFGSVRINWEFENTATGSLLNKKKEINLDSSKGELLIDDIKNKEEVTLTVSNNITTYSEPLKILLSKPEITLFKSNVDKVLQNSVFNLSWEVKNANKVFISNIGGVEAKGHIEKLSARDNYKIVAENDIGKEERLLEITLLQVPKIKEFRSKQQKIEFKKETQIVWDIENAEKIELHWMGNMEIIPNKGYKTISPSEHTNYKLIVTALDGITKEEREITVQVFKKVEIKSFFSDLDFVVESLPIKLSWEIDNASSVTLSSNIQSDIDVTGINEIEIIPKKTAVFYLKANNELFSINSPQLKIEVQNIPTFSPSIIPRLPSGKELIPSFEIDFKELANNILDESQINFQNAMKPVKRFNLLSSLQELFK